MIQLGLLYRPEFTSAKLNIKALKPSIAHDFENIAPEQTCTHSISVPVQPYYSMEGEAPCTSVPIVIGPYAEFKGSPEGKAIHGSHVRFKSGPDVESVRGQLVWYDTNNGASKKTIAEHFKHAWAWWSEPVQMLFLVRDRPKLSSEIWAFDYVPTGRKTTTGVFTRHITKERLELQRDKTNMSLLI